MRILFLVSSMHGGGAERVAATLANAWARRGDEVTLVCCYSGRGTCAYALDEGVRLLWLADRLRGPRWWRPLAKLPALRALAREAAPDRVLSFLTNVNVTALLATRGLGLPVVVSERTDPGHSVNLEPVLRWLRRWTYPWAHRVVVQTRRSMPPLMRAAPGTRRLSAIPNPLPDGLPAARDGEPGGRHRLAALGRFNPVKRFEALVEVFAGLAPRHPDWDLVIWGDGPRREACLRRVAELGLEGRILLPGRSETPWRELLGAHGFVLSSAVEGFPNAMLEAMALGLPCVAADCPSGPRELSRDGRDAALVPAGDDAALAAALDQLMSATPQWREEQGRRAAASVRARYGLDSILGRWDAAWTDARNGPEGHDHEPD
ncbi:glycosyltransferase family 4 protein [Castellaniella sp. S9]|uniref:glycosyltransferase family 4 protein n=1 Tax=Castellaniella sp. S9 TaxID=2993652 RepID=UPI0022B54FBB|nr:glycosyltransferase family 4 protein [Castellaniella sp. S9]